jgi:hypothetical protein
MRRFLRVLRACHGAMAATFVVSAAAAAQPLPAARDVARLFALEARAGATRAFEEGYRRHLDWHVASGDLWTWYLWQVTNGERAGLYVDGTFDHAWADFDGAVKPADDLADNAVNVDPHATRRWNNAWRRRRDVEGSAQAGSFDPEKAPFVVVTEYRVRPGSVRALIAAIRSRGCAATACAWFELATGGDGPRLMRWDAATNWAEIGRVLAGVSSELPGIEGMRSEIWRFRPDLSICRRAETRCHAMPQAPSAP